MKTEKGAKIEIPRELYQAIIRIQADENLDFEDACLKAALLVDPRREEFKKAVRQEADRLEKSKFMNQLNKARKTVEDNAWRKGADYVRNYEDNFHVPCNKCGKPLRLSNSHSNWATIRDTLYRAFSGWYHTTCPK